MKQKYKKIEIYRLKSNNDRQAILDYELNREKSIKFICRYPGFDLIRVVSYLYMVTTSFN